METIDDNEDVFPQETFIEVQSMSGWMTFTGVITILVAIFAILGAWGSVKGAGFASVSFLSGCFTLYVGYLLFSKASAFRLFAQTKSEEDLKKALRLNKTYFMLSAISLIISILISISNKI